MIPRLATSIVRHYFLYCLLIRRNQLVVRINSSKSRCIRPGFLPYSNVSNLIITHKIYAFKGGEYRVSIFDIFKIGIGPSSSHTVGPMKAGKLFTDDLIELGHLSAITRITVDVYGSLSLTGKGHHTDIAIIMGLAGNLSDTVDIDAIPDFMQDVRQHERLLLAKGHHEVDFPDKGGMNFHETNLPLHENKGGH